MQKHPQFDIFTGMTEMKVSKVPFKEVHVVLLVPFQYLALTRQQLFGHN